MPMEETEIGPERVGDGKIAQNTKKHRVKSSGCQEEEELEDPMQARRRWRWRWWLRRDLG